MAGKDQKAPEGLVPSLLGGEKEEALKWARERSRRMNFFLGQVGQRYVAMALESKEIPSLRPRGNKLNPLSQDGRRGF